MTYKNELQGQSGPGFAWALFDNSVDSATAPRATSSAKFTLTDADTHRVCIDSCVLYTVHPPKLTLTDADTCKVCIDGSLLHSHVCTGDSATEVF